MIVLSHPFSFTSKAWYQSVELCLQKQIYGGQYKSAPNIGIQILIMEASQETNIKTPKTVAEPNKADIPTVPELTGDDLYNKILTEMRESLNRSSKTYQAYNIQLLFKKSNYRHLTDLHLHCLVIEAQTFFKDNKAIESQMAVMRYYHEMIIQVERARTYISGIFPIMFVDTLNTVKEQNKFFYVKELKALYRIWHGYMDQQFLRKIRDQCTILCRMDIMDIDLNNKYLSKQLGKIKHSQFIAQKIITGNASGFYPNAANTYQKHPFNPKFNSWKRKNHSDKDETMSNQTNVLSEDKEKGDTSISDFNGIPEIGQHYNIDTKEHQTEGIQSKNNISKKDSKQAKKQGSYGSYKKSKPQKEQIKPLNIAKSQKMENNKQDLQTQSDKKEGIPKSQAKEDKASKLKEMYAMMLMNKKRKSGGKLLVESGTWQFCENIIQTLKEKTFKKDVYQIINTQIEEEELEWIFPQDKLNGHRDENDRPFSFSCKFCGLKLQALMEKNQEQYFKDIVCCEMSKGDRKFPKQIPCFHLKDETKEEQGLFLLHKECFEAVYKGNVDEKKWKLE